jgi:hypothetical protein
MTIPIRTFTAQEILTGNRSTAYYLEVLDSSDSFVKRLDGVTYGSFDWVANAMVKGAGQLTVQDVSQGVNWLTARIRPVMAISGLPIQPLGVYLASEAPEVFTGPAGGKSWAVKLLDKTTILDQDIIFETYSLAAGAVVTTEIINVIVSSGITNYKVQASAATLVGALTWQPGTSKLRIINDLLAVLNYFSLYANFDGQLIGEPYVVPAKRPIVYEFLDGENCIYVGEFNRDRDIWKIPNRVVIVGMGDAATAALSSSIDNTDPTSPYSIANRGRVIGYSEEGVEVADQTTLDAYARRKLIEKTTPTASVEIKHSPIPGLTVNQTARFRRTTAGIDARHTVAKTTIVLDGSALQTTILREVVDL